MKNRFKILGIVVAAALLVVGFTACDNYNITDRTPGRTFYGFFTVKLTGAEEIYKEEVGVEVADLFGTENWVKVNDKGEAEITVGLLERDFDRYVDTSDSLVVMIKDGADVTKEFEGVIHSGVTIEIKYEP